MRFCASLLSIAVFLLAGCDRESNLDYGFNIKDVSINRNDHSLNILLNQEMELSQQAREALEHGVTLNISLDLELHSHAKITAVRKESKRFTLRYLPLSERYQLLEEESGDLRTFSRLRHMLAVFNYLTVQLSTGPLPAGNYELHTRIRLDEGQLPAPMQLPAWLSSQWQHDSEWSEWPFKVNV